MTWASLLDELSRELDIVIIVSSGNVSNPNVPNFSNREDLMNKTRDQLLSDEHRLIDPATAALGVTVGSITRYAEPDNPAGLKTIPLSAGKEGYPSAFTRTGEGVNGAVKPEFVDYGGNFVIRQLGSNDVRWGINHALNEPTLNNSIDRIFKGWQGTSFAAPHVTHIAARLQRALQTQIGEEPSANLIRALLASSAKYVEKDWLEAATPIGFSGKTRQKQEWRLRLGRV
jgi:subtilisin family serine protease